MKYLFIKPHILCTEMTPLPGIPSLMGILENKNVECEYINLNADYVQYLSKEKIENYNKLLKSFYKEEEYLSYPAVYEKILSFQKPFYFKYDKWLSKNINNFDICKKILREKRYKYSYNYLFYFRSYLYCVFSHCIPFICSLVYNGRDEFLINPEDIIKVINSPLNHVKEYYEQKTEEILNKKPDITGIQITRPDELISALCLGYILKQKNKNIHINIGGNYFEDVSKKVKNLKDLFGIFFDSISIGDSTTTVLELTKYINKEIDLCDVNSLIHIYKGELKFNPTGKLSNINKLPFQSFTGYKKEDYCFPEMILPIRATTTYSCYWGKCLYCTCSGKTEPYRLMSAERFVKEIEYLSQKYNTKYFAFWDNAMHPEYMRKVADLLIKKKLNIKYNLYARLEKEFDFDLLKKMRKSGCITIAWGLDSTSQRICDYMNKGIKVEYASQILEASNKAGIFNYLYLIFAYPTETREEMDGNLKFVKENARNIGYVYAIKNVEFYEKAVLNDNYQYYKNQMDNTKEYEEYKNNIISEINKIMKTMPDLYTTGQWHFLYMAKYGRFRFSIIKHIVFYYFNCKNKYIKKIMNFYYKLIIKLF